MAKKKDELHDEIVNNAQESQNLKNGENLTEKKGKTPKLSSAEKKAKKKESKILEKEYKSWENSIVANKKVKRELGLRRMRKFMLLLLIFSLVVTGTTYAVLFLSHENSVRINAGNQTGNTENVLTLSVDKKTWESYLDVVGPKALWHATYDPEVAQKRNVVQIPSWQNAMLKTGNFSEENGFIGISFYLKNQSANAFDFTESIEIIKNYGSLDKAIRIMWIAQDEEGNLLDNWHVFAKVNNREVTTTNDLGHTITKPLLTNGVEYVAYPDGYFSGSYHYQDGDVFPLGLTKKTTPYDDITVCSIKRNILPQQILRYTLVVWIEGSDIDCTNDILSDRFKLDIGFTELQK